MPSDSWEYFLDKYLILNGEDISSVTLVPLADEETVIAKLKTGEIDAGLTIYQYASFLTTSKPDTYQMWSVNNFENNYMLLISNKEMVQKNPDAVKKLLKAFIETWDYYNANTKKVQEEFGGDSGLSVKQMEDLVSGLTPEVSLTQGLLNTLEAQSRYLLDIGSGTITNTPNYLEIIDFSFLHDIEPKKCTIIH
jgi:ABC-type nitrate/sulfonate/bicarbonate transport system substrate-binding protein